MKVLGIETSCDETSAAVVDEQFRVYSHVVLTQMEHARYGGVVPEIASRLHSKNIVKVVKKALKDANLNIREIEGIAVTYGPGLIGSLVVGLMFAKGLAQSLKLPFIGINHLEGHIFSIFLTYPELKPPILFLIVSGGHTELVMMEDWLKYRVIGATVDDAIGECYDKVAKMLGLPYPGGPVIDKLAREGNMEFVRFPIPKVGRYNFSFSGLKTAVLYYIRKQTREFIREHTKDIAASFQRSAVLSVCDRLKNAIKDFNIKKIAIVGGVANNSYLRQECSKIEGAEIFFPRRVFTTDNAAMIAAAGSFRLVRGERSELDLPAIPSLYLTGGEEK